jgi:hypothetical protein
MTDALNGQIVPALSQWHALMLIVAALALAALASGARRARGQG